MAETVIRDEKQEALEARERLRSSVDELVARTNLHVKAQAEPLKYMGGSAGGGLVLGFLLGRRGRKTQKVYVERSRGRERALSKAEQKAELRAEKRGARGSRGGLGGAVTGILVTTLLKIVQERFLAPQLESYADRLLEKSRDASRPAKPSESRRSS